jgi:peptidoglycan/xylan/chitin deacetylase (PgdA/CDA1 family)
MTYVVITACVVLVLFLVLQYSLFVPATKGLPVLLYHKVSLTHEDGLTIKPAALEKQLQYLRSRGYQTVSVREVLAFQENRTPLPKKPVMISFDDGFVNNLELACPLLRKHQCKAVFFIPSSGIGKTNFWDNTGEHLMSTEQLKSLDQGLFEIALHSFDHKNYKHMTPEEIKTDITRSMEVFTQNGIGFVPGFAYPYGGRPKDKTVYAAMIKAFSDAGIGLAFRIGNKVNKLPLKNPFEVRRISIRGTDSMWTFRTKIAKGRVKQL